jgi:hypothetical protein
MLEADSTRPATWFADDATGIPKHYGVREDLAPLRLQPGGGPKMIASNIRGASGLWQSLNGNASGAAHKLSVR